MVADVMASGYRHSTVLTREENEQIMRLLGNRCESLATSVVQLFSTEPPDHGAWVKKDAGVLCLVKDHLKRSYFLRIYCPTRKSLVWEHEVYNGMEYNQPRSFLHTFEGQEGIIAFNFASEDDARVMHNVLLQKLDRKQRRMERKSRSSYATSRHSSSPPSNFTGGNVANQNVTLNGNQRPPAYQQQPRTMPSQLPPPALPGKGGKNKGNAKAKLTKADIGLPSGFRHVSHVGWDPNKGFDVDVEDPQLKHFFVKAGVSDTQLQDRETRQFIYDFINQHGGLEAVKEDESFAPPPVPARGPGGPVSSPGPPGGARHAPPPPPPPNRTPAPPPPPARTMPQRPPEAQHSQPSRPNANAAPPPPPPPPPPPSAPAFDVPPPPSRSAAEPDAHSALMNAIKGGKSLKPAAESEPRPTSGGDSRDELLGQIRSGKQLKPVQHVEKPPPIVGTADILATALSRALAERKRANQSDSESDSDNSDSDNDWSDN